MKKNKIIILVTILLLIMSLFVGGYLINKNKQNKEQEKIMQKRVEELVKNNYLLSYILYGDVSVNDGMAVINNITYYYLKDDILKDIKTLNDIVELIENTMLPDDVGNYIEKLNNEKYNRYIEQNGFLYVAKTANACKNMPDYADIKYKKDGDNYLIEWNNNSVNATKTEENLFLSALAYDCFNN